MIYRTLLFLSFLSGMIFTGFSQEQTAALKSWHDNKFSMFIHFGVYSELGGVWQGKPIENGYSEQIQAHAGIMADIYEEVPSRFNPTKWNADEIATLAKNAGMRSIVITSKHHDGFCMYKSAYTRFNVVDATPFKRDVIEELSQACKKQGLNFGLYFSLIDYTIHPFMSHNANPITPDHHEYNKKQVAELLTNYGPISELWFDMGSLTAQQSRELYNLVHKLQPGCMVSGRLGNNAYDFCVMGDNAYPDFKIDAPWQTPASIFNETWGYRSWQKRENTPAKTREKLLSLIKVVSRGGNYLLNIGPKGDGSVVPYEKEVLTGIGNWLRKNGEAIYGTSANPFPDAFPWGEITTSNNNLYLILSGKATVSIVLPGISGKIRKASLLNGSKTILKAETKKGNLTLSVPGSLFQNDDFQVILLEFEDKYQIQPEKLITGKPINLTFQNAIKHYSYACQDYYNNHRSIVNQSWNFSTKQQNAIPTIFYTEEELGKEIALNWNGQSEIVRLTGCEKIPANKKSALGKWGNRFSYGPIQSDFEELPGPISAQVNTSMAWSNRNELTWNLITGWENVALVSMITKPFQAFYILQEISAEMAYNQLIELGSGDGIQVWLNGENLVNHNNPRNSRINNDIVMLPLKTGKNQLLIKFYNRYRYLSAYSINNNIDQSVYFRKLAPRTFSEVNNCELKLSKPESFHEPIRMNNVRIKL